MTNLNQDDLENILKELEDFNQNKLSINLNKSIELQYNDFDTFFIIVPVIRHKYLKKIEDNFFITQNNYEKLNISI